MDLPLTFNSAISHISTAAQKHSSAAAARPHAATVGPEAKVNASSILKTTRQRGESEPIISAIVAIESKPKVKEAPKPDRKSQIVATVNM
jgi:hypothetical protein